MLFALVDSDYCFEYIDVGAEGRGLDERIFQNSSLCVSLENDFLNMSPNVVIVGDNTFLLKKYLMEPYSWHNLSQQEMIYNYRHSSARRVVENTFGILVKNLEWIWKTNVIKTRNSGQNNLCNAVLYINKGAEED